MNFGLGDDAGDFGNVRCEVGRKDRLREALAERFRILETTDRFDHCVFTVRDDFDPATEKRWLEALFAKASSAYWTRRPNISGR